MAKAKATSKSPRTARGASPSALRTRLDRLDSDLVKLLNERAKVALELLEARDSSGQPLVAGTRDEEALNRVIELNKGPLGSRCIRTVFTELISGVRALQRGLKVGYLGPAYSYSHLAALQKFGQSAELIPVGSIAAVFEEVTRGQVDYGVVPIENSTDGRIADTLDMFTRLPARICAEVQLPIHHYLLARCARSDVEDVFSRPQALSQCRNWLAKHLPAARAVEVTSTSTAAKLAQDKPGAAAIASLEAGTHYGLNVLAEKIEDNQANVTRFAVIGKVAAARTGRDKTALMFEVEHRPGSLADAINIFKRNRLNLTWIESFPIPDRAGRYLFFLEVDGHEHDTKIRRALEALGRRALRLEVVGAFPRNPGVE